MQHLEALLQRSPQSANVSVGQSQKNMSLTRGGANNPKQAGYRLHRSFSFDQMQSHFYSEAIMSLSPKQITTSAPQSEIREGVPAPSDSGGRRSSSPMRTLSRAYPRFHDVSNVKV